MYVIALDLVLDFVHVLEVTEVVDYLPVFWTRGHENLQYLYIITLGM